MTDKNVLKTIAVTALVPVAALLLWVGFRAYYQAAFPVRYTQQVEAASRATGLEQALLYAVVRTESGFCPDAQSSVGARGLMQITPDTLSWVRYRMGETGATQPELLFQPEQNINYGAHTLALLVQEFGGVDTALAAYHAGWGSVKGWLKDEECSADGQTLVKIPFADTDHYVAKVLETAAMYKRVYPNLT